MLHKNNSFSKELNLESFFLLIKLGNDIYTNNSQKNLLLEQTYLLDLVSNIKIKYPDINLGSASIVNKQSIEDSIKIGLKFSMMKFWDKDLFNFAKKKTFIIPGIKNLKDLREAINLNCKIIKIYPVKSKDDSIDINEYNNIDFIAAGDLSINDLGYYKSIGYKSIVIGDKGFNNQEIDPKIYEFLQKNESS